MSDSPAVPVGPPVRQRVAWRVPAILAVLTVALISGARIALAHDRAVQSLATSSAGLLGLSLICLWVLLVSGLPVPRRIWFLLGVVGVAGVLAGSFIIRHFSGDIVPQLGFRLLDPQVSAGDSGPAERARWLERAAPWAAVLIGGAGLLGCLASAIGISRPVWASLLLAAGGTAAAGNGGAWWTQRQASQQPPPPLAAGGKADLLTTTARDFPQFLGAQRDGRVPAVRLARNWDENPPRRLWRRPCGEGWSGFAVVGDFAVTQERRDDAELVICYRLLTGEPVWEHSTPGTFAHPLSGNGPRATPTIDQGRVYCLTSLGVLNCLNGENGSLVWSHDILAEHEAVAPQWGMSGSPLIWRDQVLVMAGGAGGGSLVAYDAVSGASRWQSGNSPASYVSPALARVAGREQVLLVGRSSVEGHDPATGEVLWVYDWPGGEPKVPQPWPVSENRVWIGAGYGLGCNVLEIVPAPQGAGKLPFVAQEVWGGFNRQLKPKFTNVVVRDDHVYGLDDGKSLVCLELATGKLAWRGGRYGHGQLLLVDDLLLIVTDSGDLVLVEANPTAHRELARTEGLVGQSWNTPALAGPYLLLRNAEQATCLELTLDQ